MEIEFNAIRLPDEVYFYIVLVNNFTDSKKMILLKEKVKSLTVCTYLLIRSFTCKVLKYWLFLKTSLFNVF